MAMYIQAGTRRCADYLMREEGSIGLKVEDTCRKYSQAAALELFPTDRIYSRVVRPAGDARACASSQLG
jgi:hypothetical protein